MKQLTEKDIERLLNDDCSAEESKAIREALPHHPELESLYHSWKPVSRDFSAAAVKTPDSAFTQALVAAMHKEMRRKYRPWYDQPPLYFFIIIVFMLTAVTLLAAPASIEQMTGGYIILPEMGLSGFLQSLLPWQELELPLIAGVCLVLLLTIDRVLQRSVTRKV